MIQGRTILCFASGYDAPPTSKHHVMHLLAERNVVLWVNYHGSRVPSASGSDLRHIARKLGQVAGGLTRPRPNLFVLTPMVLPLPGSAWARRANRAMLVRQIKSALGRTAAGPLQVWSFTPDIAYLLDDLPAAEKVLYYCVDDHASFSGYDREQVLADEADLCRRADLVVTTSAALQRAKAPLNPNTILVSHGVDHGHFARALRNGLPEPSDIAAIPRPRLGFAGLIRDWVDLDLLAGVARLRPDWHIVLIGDSTVDLAPYRPLTNMHFLGRRPYGDLPAYFRRFDVGLVPFKVNELTRAVNPIKLREYLAAGLPVVSTPLPEVRALAESLRAARPPRESLPSLPKAHSPVQSPAPPEGRSPREWPPPPEAQLPAESVAVRDTADAFAAAIGQALAARSPASAAARSAAMTCQTWPAKLDAISRRLAAGRPAPVPAAEVAP